MIHPTICTVAAENYLPRVNALAESLDRHHPDARLVLLLLSDNVPSVKVGSNIELLRCASMDDSLRRLREKYSDIKQVCTALKPALMSTLLDRSKGPVLYLDPDTWITGSLVNVFTTVSRHSLSLTPHMDSTGMTCWDKNSLEALLLAGQYNAGVVGVSNHRETQIFLSWWEQRLTTHCINDVHKGFHYDQRWLDHSVGFIRDLHIFRDPGLNCAYWNMNYRKWTEMGGEWFLDGEALKLFHFSGFDPAQPDFVSQFLPEARVDQLQPPLRRLFEQYLDCVLKHRPA